VLTIVDWSLVQQFTAVSADLICVDDVGWCVMERQVVWAKLAARWDGLAFPSRGWPDPLSARVVHAPAGGCRFALAT
jgi:hypothetical protein